MSSTTTTNNNSNNSTTSNKEDAKNMALLFFMDHLMQKNGRRTIHDLSCQFGARGFSQEMRDAVGATQEGLSEFLAQYPSLFTLEGDLVTMKGYGDLALGGAKASPLLQTLARDRDYEKEAVEFFEEKLNRFGPELQIKSLLGHRSQSAPEIRLVSGRHVKDFTEFLMSHPSNFVVESDRVRLRHMPEPSAEDGQVGDLDENGALLAGAKAKQKAVDYLKEYVESQESPIPMDSLYKQFCGRFSHIVRQEVATNPKELLQFLKLNRHIFFIRSNKVSIVRNRDLSLMNGAESGNATAGDWSADGSSANTLDNGDSSSVDSGREGGGGLDASSTESVTVVVKSLKSAQTAMADIAGAYCGPPSAFNDLGDVVAVDFKLVTLGQQEFLTLIIVAAANGRLFVFDVAHSSSILIESGLKDLLETNDFVKVIHDCKKICALLWQQYKISLRNVFDTQIANLVLQHQRTGRPLHEIKPVSFLTLQRLYHPQSLMYSDNSPAQNGSKKEQRFWSVRPLSDEMIQLCVTEARFLIPFIYKSMSRALKPDMRSLFNRLCEESAFVNNNNESNSNRSSTDDISNSFSFNYYNKNANGQMKRRSLLLNSSEDNNNKYASSPCCSCKCHRLTVVDAACQTTSSNI